MAVSRQVGASAWVAVWKDQSDASHGKAVETAADPLKIEVDFTGCKSVSRLLWPVTFADGDEDTLSLRIDLTILAAGTAMPVGWIAFVEGPSAQNVTFFRKLKNNIDASDLKSPFEWHISRSEALRSKDKLFFCLHFNPNASPAEIIFNHEWRKSTGLIEGATSNPPSDKFISSANGEVADLRPTSTADGEAAGTSPTDAASIDEGGHFPPKLLRRVADLFAGLSSENLALAWNKLEEQVVLRRAKSLYKEKSWKELAQLGTDLHAGRPHRRETSILFGRSQIQTNQPNLAARALQRLTEDVPDDPEAHYFAAIALGRDHRNKRALDFAQHAIELRPDNGRFQAEKAIILRRLAAETTDHHARELLLSQCIEAWTRASELNPDLTARAYARIAQIHLDRGRFDQAMSHVELALAAGPTSVDILMVKGGILLALNRFREAMEIAEEVHSLEPEHQGARFYLRALRNLAEGGAEKTQASIGIVDLGQEYASIMEYLSDLIQGTSQNTHSNKEITENLNLGTLFADLRSDWLVFGNSISNEDIWAFLPEICNQERQWCGRILARSASGDITEFWRRELVQGFIESALITDISTLQARLRQLSPLVATWNLGLATEEKWERAKGLAVLMSRHGTVKFGGGEQFLDSMAEHYRELGYRVLIIGTRPELVGQSGLQGESEFAFVDESPASLRRFFIEKRPDVVHVLSGLGFQVAEALDYLNIPFIYGVHYWRDCLGITNQSSYFEDFDRGPIAKPEFRYIIQRAASIYSNSDYTREILEQAFQFRSPVLYSLPRQFEEKPGAENQDGINSPVIDLDDFVLLANTKSNKGFDLLTKVAKLCPEINFVALASQSDPSEAETVIANAGLANFRIYPRTDHMEAFYRKCRLVAVPSYAFVETFSRVCIEAHRFSKPVLGSDRGNVPYLLEQSGVILPEDANAWSSELKRIYTDEAYHEALVEKSKRNSIRYDYSLQRNAVHGVLSNISSRLLIGVGSGIGNMLHVAPMLRNMSRRLGQKLDIVVAEDHNNSLFLLHNREYINSSYALNQNILRKEYDTVFLTHCFGSAAVQFHARKIISSRSWANFEPGGEYHETVFNLESAKRLMNVDYHQDDITQYYIGDYSYTPPPKGRRIGLHGGSKEGFWTSKRWPGYSRLAQALTERGYEVASFGIEPEYVDGTLNLTGGTISEMIEGMLSCSYFVSNDSGLMNIANALSIPLTALFGPTNPATRGPLRATSTSLSIQKDCAPCEISLSGKARFLAGECRCIAELDFDRVLDHVLVEIGRYID